MRIAKRIAASGVASRREAEAMIVSGRIAVDGKPLLSPAFDVTEQETITLDDRPLPCPSPLALYLFHKPREVLTARIDRSARACLPDLLPAALARLKPVGRLDFLSEGLLLMTTSGELARFCELPKNAWARGYRLRLHGVLDKKARMRFDGLQKGITIEGMRYRPVRVRVEKTTEDMTPASSRSQEEGEQRRNFWIEATLHEGKNRELRKIMNALGYRVSRLIRTHYGPFTLGGLAQGACERVSDKELRAAVGETFFARSQGRAISSSDT